LKKLLGMLIPLLTVLISLIAVPPDQTPVGQNHQGPPKFGGDFHFYADDYYLPGESEVGSSALHPVTTVDSLDYTLLTFMSIRDDNWEIYTSDRTGGDLTRLTDHSRVDAAPRLNRGSTRITFSSNRDGKYEILTTIMARISAG
jgi:hypothetical protein